jgi:putative membrane protein
MMARLILRLLIGALGLWLADVLLGGLSIDNWIWLLAAAIVLGVVNAILRPVLFVLTLPVTVVTLGLFLFVLNGMMIGLVAWLLKGVELDNLWTAILAAIITGLVSWFGQIVTKEPKRE